MIENGFLYALGSVLVVSAISLIGFFGLSINTEKIKKGLFLLVSLSIGALLGDAFIHLIPEALKETSRPSLVSLLVIGGIMLFFIFEKILGWHHHHHERPADCKDCVTILPVGRLVLVSDGLHNFVDGIIIGISYLVSIEIGIATTLAVILHEIPQEIGDFGILIHAGYTKAKALWFNFLSALLAVLGTILVFSLGRNIESLVPFILALSAGNFIYIAAADLLPELHKEHGVKQSVLETLFVIIGILILYLLVFFN